MGKRNAYGISMGKLERKEPLGIPRCRWLDNIKMNAGEFCLGEMDLINLAQDRDQLRALVSTAIKVEKFLSNCTTGDFSRRAHLHGVAQLTFLRRFC
jgi:hypothetical protein